jgi:hypothetical protein
MSDGMFMFEPMSVEEIKFKKAIEKGELVQFLGGFPDYYIQSRYADMPTEYDCAFDPIRARIKDDPHLRDAVLDAIKTLAKDPVYGWGAIYHIANLALVKQYEGIDLISPDLLSAVADGLKRNKEAYKALKRWDGQNHEDGVWALVRAKNRGLRLRHNITVLPEEL